MNRVIYRLEGIRTQGSQAYEVQVKVLDAKSAGVPQSRERLFIVGRRHEWVVRPIVWP